MIQGIDASDAQGFKLPMQGKDFALIKATEGRSYTNAKQGVQSSSARAAAAHVGFYHFLWPGNVQEQADWFVNQCASVPGDSLWCDWEPTNGGLASCADKDLFIHRVQAARPTHRVGLYCDRERWLHVDTTSFAGDGLWIADPSSPAGSPLIKDPWLIHQYGSPGGVDADVAQFPTQSAMFSWAQRGGPGKPAPLPKPPPRPGYPTYKVVEGDTLSGIATRHNVSVEALVRLNGIKDPDKIYPGQVLRLR
jgi:LysM repeat protein